MRPGLIRTFFHCSIDYFSPGSLRIGLLRLQSELGGSKNVIFCLFRVLTQLFLVNTKFEGVPDLIHTFFHCSIDYSSPGSLRKHSKTLLKFLKLLKTVKKNSQVAKKVAKMLQKKLQKYCKKVAKKSCRKVSDRFNKMLHKTLQRNVKVAKSIAKKIAKKFAEQFLKKVQKIHSPMDIWKICCYKTFLKEGIKLGGFRHLLT